MTDAGGIRLAPLFSVELSLAGGSSRIDDQPRVLDLIRMVVDEMTALQERRA